MTCPGCGIQHLKVFKFCPECGERLAALTPPAPEADQTAATSAPFARLDEAAQAARLLEQAFELYDEGRYEEALGCCQASAALNPTGSAAHSLLGMIYERLGKTADAVHQYRLVLQMNPDSIADAVKLEALQGRRGTAGQSGIWFGRLMPISRIPAAAGAIVAAVALVAGIWATSRALGQGSTAPQRMAARSSRQAVPGASMPRPAVGMPGAEATFAPPPGAMPSAPAAGSSSAATTPAARPLASLPSPPAADAWPALHPGYPSAPPISRAARGSTAGKARGRYLAPAPIQGLEKLDPRQARPTADLPGASLPASREGASRRSSRGAAPVLPAVTDTAEARPTAAEPPAAPGTTVPAPPPSASMSIQPLDDAAAAAARGPRSTAPPERPASLTDALRHEQMAAYYRRQGDDQAAYGEYQYARDLFRRIQERGGREAAVAAQGAVAAQYGMSRLQGP